MEPKTTGPQSLILFFFKWIYLFIYLYIDKSIIVFKINKVLKFYINRA